MTAAAYDTSPYIDPVPRIPGWHNVRATVVWIPRKPDGAAAKAMDCEVCDAHTPDGVITLGDGGCRRLSTRHRVSAPGPAHGVIALSECLSHV